MTVVQMTPITAFPGTDFYTEMKEKGMITSNNFKHYNLFHPMMRTEQLTNIEIYRLVAEAYSAYYLSKGWLKMLIKRYFNPFGKFNWMLSNVPKFIKTVIVSGLDMLRTMGMTRDILSDEMKEIMKRAEEGKPLFSEKTPEQIEKEKAIPPLSKKPKETEKVTDLELD